MRKKHESYGFTCYHKFIYSALIQQVHVYEEIWAKATKCTEGQGIEDQCATALDEVEETAIPVILLAHCMVEALGNWHLQMNCDAEQFALLERSRVLAKWTVLPRVWLEKYSLEKDSALYQEIDWLVLRRNRITHAKSEVELEGAIVHKGNLPGSLPAPPKSEHQFIEACKTLPHRLIANLKEFDSSSMVSIMLADLQVQEESMTQRYRRTKPKQSVLK